MIVPTGRKLATISYVRDAVMFYCFIVAACIATDVQEEIDPDATTAISTDDPPGLINEAVSRSPLQRGIDPDATPSLPISDPPVWLNEVDYNASKYQAEFVCKQYVDVGDIEYSLYAPDGKEFDSGSLDKVCKNEILMGLSSQTISWKDDDGEDGVAVCISSNTLGALQFVGFGSASGLASVPKGLCSNLDAEDTGLSDVSDAVGFTIRLIGDGERYDLFTWFYSSDGQGNMNNFPNSGQRIVDISDAPTWQPSVVPTDLPTPLPSEVPSAVPTVSPQPSAIPTNVPTPLESAMPTEIPTSAPSEVPSTVPSIFPTEIPTTLPSDEPTEIPSTSPSEVPSLAPSTFPTEIPTTVPSDEPTEIPSTVPSQVPSLDPTPIASDPPTKVPSEIPSSLPTSVPTISSQPSLMPSTEACVECQRVMLIAKNELRPNFINETLPDGEEEYTGIASNESLDMQDFETAFSDAGQLDPLGKKNKRKKCVKICKKNTSDQEIKRACEHLCFAVIRDGFKNVRRACSIANFCNIRA